MSSAQVAGKTFIDALCKAKSINIRARKKRQGQSVLSLSKQRKVAEVVNAGDQIRRSSLSTCRTPQKSVEVGHQ
jgi:hypothetical protein